MLDKFKQLEKRKLDSLGKEKVSLQEKLKIEEERLRQITSVSQSMTKPVRQSALYHQNHTMINDKIRNLIETQKQEVDLVNLELQKIHDSIIDQYGKVKGLEKQLKKNASHQEKRLEQNEQALQDDLSSRQFGRGNPGLGHQ